MVAVDIGTNTEVTVTKGGRIWCCSCASGPAFEGAHIRDGMRAAPGAIERVQIVDGKPRLKTIGDLPPVGICGSGIMDAVSELLRAGIISRKGVIAEGAPGVGRENDLLHYVLAAPAVTGHGRAIVVTRKDINEIQLAKAAIRVGVDILLHEAGAGYEEIEEFIVAGAFGTYLDIASTVRTGMFPPLPLERFKQVGNAAGAGARQMLISAERRTFAAQRARQVAYVELTVHPEFAEGTSRRCTYPRSRLTPFARAVDAPGWCRRLQHQHGSLPAGSLGCAARGALCSRPRDPRHRRRRAAGAGRGAGRLRPPANPAPVGSGRGAAGLVGRIHSPGGRHLRGVDRRLAELAQAVVAALLRS